MSLALRDVAIAEYESNNLRKSWRGAPEQIINPDWEAVLEGRMQHLGISRRKREVLWHLLAGMSTEEIADALYIRPKTVKGHISQVYTKLNLIAENGRGYRTHMRTHVLLFLIGIDTARLRASLKAREHERQ